MSPKNAVTTALLLFVAASILVLTVKSLRQNSSASDGRPAAESNGVAPSRPDRLIAYYFHGKVRCPTCQSIEAYAHETVAASFADELKDGRIEWRVVDFETPATEHFAKDYNLVAPSVVLVEMRGGAQKRWKNLPEVWELVGDKPAFIAFVQKEIRAFLDAAEKN